MAESTKELPSIGSYLCSRRKHCGHKDVLRTADWLLLSLAARRPPDALGTRVTLTAGGTRQLRERRSASSYLSSHDPRLHFGLGDATRADLEIQWPDGTIQFLADVAADQILRVVQPSE